MDFEGNDRLQLQVLAGGNVVTQPPLHAPNGEYLFLINAKLIQVYSTQTGELVRQLVDPDAQANLISMEFELRHNDVMVACTELGEVLRWDWQTGALKEKKQLMNLPAGRVITFNLINFYANSQTACAFCTTKASSNDRVHWCVVNTGTGSKILVPCSLELYNKLPLVAVDNKNFPTIVLTQGFHIYFLNYETWQWTRMKSAYKTPITCVRVHPTEELVATGDENGQIFLWRQFYEHRTVKTSLYHWHHTAITSIAFSASGTSFFSSGLEAVLVKWNVRQPELRSFIPRMCANIEHIAVSHDNTQMAICTADNGVQIMGADTEIQATLQEFTYIADDKTGKSKFPIGMRLNPRTNTLVLNGRAGHLQFYSAYTKSLLYNMDIVQQNRLSTETDKILYNIYVTKAAFNIDWMATGEVFNDEEHLPELRLKFWRYEAEKQSYTLNTSIELPHESGFKAIEFSNDYQVDNLICATVGDDNTIKIWTLDESDSIYKKGKVWYCNGQTSYKNMPIESISFSQDGSLLAAGYGNTLCIYKADTLQLKAALSSTPGFDGCIQKAQIRVPKQKINGAKNDLLEQRKKLLQLFTKLLENNEETLIKELHNSLGSSKKKVAEPQLIKLLEKIDDKQRAQLYQKVLEMPDLNLFQKILLYQKLGIQCKVHPQYQAKMMSYLNETVAPAALHKKTKQLHAQINRLNLRERFKAKYRLDHCQRRLRNYEQEITQNLVPLLSVLSLNKISKPASQATNGINSGSNEVENETKSKIPVGHTILPPVQSLAEITQVHFAAGEHAHLVVVCTETRVLIWNLLTLRLQSTLKLSVQHLAFDAQTNLIAAFTKYNELHVFQPNVPLPIYTRPNLPNLYGAIWLPRRHPKQRSLNNDWQAQSTLYFLTESQEIMYLSSPDEAIIDFSSSSAATVSFNNAAAAPEALRYSTFGTFATQKYSDKQTALQQQKGPLIIGKSGQSAVKSIIEMSTHTMPPLSLLCVDFVKSLVKPVDSSRNPDSSSSSNSNATDNNKQLNGNDDGNAAILMNGNATHSDAEDDDDNENADNEQTTNEKALKMRKTILEKIEKFETTTTQKYNKSTHIGSSSGKSRDAETLLKRVAAQNIELEF